MFSVSRRLRGARWKNDGVANVQVLAPIPERWKSRILTRYALSSYRAMNAFNDGVGSSQEMGDQSIFFFFFLVFSHSKNCNRQAYKSPGQQKECLVITISVPVPPTVRGLRVK